MEERSKCRANTERKGKKVGRRWDRHQLFVREGGGLGSTSWIEEVFFKESNHGEGKPGGSILGGGTAGEKEEFSGGSGPEWTNRRNEVQSCTLRRPGGNDEYS